MGVLILFGRLSWWLHSVQLVLSCAGETRCCGEAVILCYCMVKSVMAMPILS